MISPATIPAVRRQKRRRSKSGFPVEAVRDSEKDHSVLPADGDAVQLHPVIDEAEAEPFGDLLLERLELVVGEFDHLAGLDVDQMVVMGLGRRLVAGAAIAEIVALE